jgi:hypothetical protein
MQMLDTERLDVQIPLTHKVCTKVNVERVLLKYMTQVSHESESDLWDQLSQEGVDQRRTATATIFESMEIANYLDLEPVIRMLCRCIARVINTMCADTTEITERFQMQEQDSMFNRISPDLWQKNLFSLLSNDKRDMMFASCSASPLNNGMEHWKKDFNLLLVGLPRRLEEIQELTEHMNTAIEGAHTIAEMWVEEWNDEDSPKTQHLHEIMGKLIGIELDYYRVLENKKSKYRFGVMELIIECEGNIRSTTDNIQDKTEKVQSAKETIRKGAEEIIRDYLEGHKKHNTSLLAQLTTVVARVFLSNEEEDEHDNSDDEEIRSRIEPLIRNLFSRSEASEGGSKRQKTRGGNSRATSCEAARRTKLRDLRNDIRTFPEGCVWQLVISVILCVSSYCCVCVLILLCMCPHTAVYVSSYCCVCVLILLYMCPHTAVYVSSYYCVCVLILLCMCPHPAAYVSSSCCICVPSNCYVCALKLLYMCPHTPLCVCSGDLSKHADGYGLGASVWCVLLYCLFKRMRLVRP